MTTHIAPTDASVWKIVKNEGEKVTTGDQIVILESMKMEIPVLAELDGTISKLYVTENQPIEEDDPIAEIE